jgi:hypothetical protein
VRCVHRLVVAAICVAAAGCAGIDFSPSSVETWSGPPFPVARVTSIDVLPIADVRTINRGASVRSAQLVREAALSLLREKGYVATAAGDALAATSSSAPAEAVLDVTAIADRSPSASGFVLALAVEETEPDVLVAPATIRVRLRGVIVDVADRVVVWAGAAVGEAGSLTGAIAMSPGATLYTAIVQAVRALLADLPARHASASVSQRAAGRRASGSTHPRRAIDDGVRPRGEEG